MEGGFYGPDVDPYAFINSGGAYGHSLSRKLFFALIEEVRRHLNTALSTENALRHVHRHRDTIAANIEYEFETRGYGKEQWHSQIAKIEKFVKNCGGFFQGYTDEYFSHKTSPVIEDRVAVIEGENRRRHVIYRAADGQLHEISVSAGGSREQDSPISMLAKAPRQSVIPVPTLSEPGAVGSSTGECRGTSMSYRELRSVLMLRPGVTRTSPRNSTFPSQVVIRQWSSLTACRTSFM